MERLDSVFTKIRADLEVEQRRARVDLESRRAEMEQEFVEKEAALREQIASDMQRNHDQWRWITRVTGAASGPQAALQEPSPKRQKTADEASSSGAAAPSESAETPEIVELNVGGKSFTTTRSTLTRVPESMLAAMFSGRHPVGRGPDGRFFIDCEGSGFHVVLDFLRHGRLVLEDAELPFLKQRIQCDAEFYCLPELAAELKDRVTAAARTKVKLHELTARHGELPKRLEAFMKAVPSSRIVGYSHAGSWTSTCLLESPVLQAG